MNSVSSSVPQILKGDVVTGERYLEWCDGLGMLIIIVVLVYVALAYYHIKKHYGKTLYNIFEPVHTRWRTLMEQR
jgi:hypothetical protein